MRRYESTKVKEEAIVVNDTTTDNDKISKRREIVRRNVRSQPEHKQVADKRLQKKKHSKVQEEYRCEIVEDVRSQPKKTKSPTAVADEEESKSPTAIATTRPTEAQIALKKQCQAVTKTAEVATEAVATVEQETETDLEMETVDQVPQQEGHRTTSIMSDRPVKLVILSQRRTIT